MGRFEIKLKAIHFSQYNFYCAQNTDKHSYSTIAI